MKINEYNQMMAYLTKPKEKPVIPKSKPKKSTREAYKEYLEIRPFLDAESQMFIEKEMGFDDGGQVIGKPGGLVEPGVTHYGKYSKEDIGVRPKTQKLVDNFLKQSIAEGKTNFKTMTELAEKIKGVSYNTVDRALNKSPYKNQITVISETNKLDAEIRDSEWFKNKYGDKTIKEAAKVEKLTPYNVRSRYKTWKANKGKMFTAEFAEKLGVSPSSLRELQSYSQRKILPRHSSDMKSRIRRAKLYKKLLDESGVTYTGGGQKQFRYTATEEQIEKLKNSFKEANLKFTKLQVDEINAKTKSLYDDMVKSGNKLTKAKFADLVLDNLSFKPSTAALYRSIDRNIPKQDFAPMPESQLQRPKQTKASNIASGKESKFIRQSQNRLMNTVKAHFKSMSDKELRAFIENNPLLKAQVELRFQNNKFKPNYGEFFTKSIDELSDEELRKKSKITVEHIKPYSKAGINVNWPYNRQLAISHINQTLKRQVESFLDKNEGKLKDPKIPTEIKNKLRRQIQAIDNKFKDMNLRLFAGDKGYRGVSEGIAAIDRTAGTLPSYYKTLEGMGLDPNAYAKGEFGKVNVKTVNEFLKVKLAALGCPTLTKATGGRIGFQEGTTPSVKCIREGAKKINFGNIKPGSEARNATQFLKGAYKLGKNVIKFGVIPEAMYVTGESLLRMGLGDTKEEAFYRASEYLLPGNQTEKANILRDIRTLNPEIASIIVGANDYKKALENLKNVRVNTEIDIQQNDPDFTGITNERLREIQENQIKQAEQNIKNKFQPEAVTDFAAMKEAESQDIAKSQAFFPKFIQKVRDRGVESDIETIAAPEIKQKKIAAPMLTLEDLSMNVPDEFLKLYRENLQSPNLTKLDVLKNLRQVPASDVNEDIFRAIFQSGRANLANRERLLGANATFFGQPISPTPAYDFAGGGIAKLAGVDSGPAPKSGPTPQGLDFLMKRGR